jgi:hypothetical protein
VANSIQFPAKYFAGAGALLESAATDGGQPTKSVGDYFKIGSVHQVKSGQ